MAKVVAENTHGLRRSIMVLVEAFPGSTAARIGRFLSQDVSAQVARLVSEGALSERDTPAGVTGRPTKGLFPTADDRSGASWRNDLADEQEKANAAVTLGLRRITVQGEVKGATEAARRHAECALMLARLMFRAPHRYGREVALVDVVTALGGAASERRWMRGARLLERQGLIDLFERKGAGRTTTVRIRNPPPYPLD